MQLPSQGGAPERPMPRGSGSRWHGPPRVGRGTGSCAGRVQGVREMSRTRHGDVAVSKGADREGTGRSDQSRSRASTSSQLVSRSSGEGQIPRSQKAFLLAPTHLEQIRRSAEDPLQEVLGGLPMAQLHGAVQKKGNVSELSACKGFAEAASNTRHSSALPWRPA